VAGAPSRRSWEGPGQSFGEFDFFTTFPFFFFSLPGFCAMPFYGKLVLHLAINVTRLLLVTHEAREKAFVCKAEHHEPAVPQ
jgi:hypothetical protein